MMQLISKIENGRVIRIAGNASHFPEAGFRLMFPRRCSALLKVVSQEFSSS